VTEAHACEQLAQGCHLEADRPRFEPATFRIASERSTVTPHRPRCMTLRRKNKQPNQHTQRKHTHTHTLTHIYTHNILNNNDCQSDLSSQSSNAHQSSTNYSPLHSSEVDRREGQVDEGRNGELFRRGQSPAAAREIISFLSAPEDVARGNRRASSRAVCRLWK